MYYPRAMAKVVYWVQDLLFTSKIREVAKQMGVEAVAARDLAQVTSLAGSAQLVIVDLRREGALALLDALPPEVQKVGFIDHEREDVMEAARQKGCRAYAKGKFSTELPSLLANLC